MQLRQRLDHGLVAADDLVGDEADPHLAGGDDDDLLVRVGLAGGVELLAQAQEGHELAAHAEEAASARAVLVGGGELEAFLHRRERDDVPALADADQEPVDDGQRQRQAQRHRGAEAGHGGEVDRAAHRLDGALDHVHADAASERAEMVLAVENPGWKRNWWISCSERAAPGWISPFSLGLGADAGGVEAAAIVLHRDQDLGADIAGGELDAAGGGLAGGGAGLGVLDAVVDGVADEVDEGIGEALDHGLVHLGVLADRDELDRLGEVAGEIVDEAAEAGEEGAHRHHAHAHGGVAQAGGEALDLLGDGLDREVVADMGELGEPGLGDDELADAVHQLVEALGLDAHGGALVVAAPVVLGLVGGGTLGRGGLARRRLRRDRGLRGRGLPGRGAGRRPPAPPASGPGPGPRPGRPPRAARWSASSRRRRT